MKLIVGLGNPGDKYQNTRHNLGFIVVDNLVEKMESGGWRLDQKFKSEIIKTDQVIFVKPQTFMNNSGMAVKLLADYFKISVSDIIIVHDELDLPLGKIKIRVGGSAAGHHGVESVIKYLGNDKFARVRMGIGNEHALAGERKSKHFDAEKFVVDDFNSAEKPKIKKMIKETVIAVKIILDQDLETAQNQYN